MSSILSLLHQGDSWRGDGRDPRPPSSFLRTEWDQVESIKTMNVPISSAEIFAWTYCRSLRLIFNWTGRSRATVGSGRKLRVGWSLRKMSKRSAITTFTFHFSLFTFHFFFHLSLYKHGGRRSIAGIKESFTCKTSAGLKIITFNFTREIPLLFSEKKNQPWNSASNLQGNLFTKFF